MNAKVAVVLTSKDILELLKLTLCTMPPAQCELCGTQYTISPTAFVFQSACPTKCPAEKLRVAGRAIAAQAIGDGHE